MFAAKTHLFPEKQEGRKKEEERSSSTFCNAATLPPLGGFRVLDGKPTASWQQQTQFVRNY